MRRFLALVLAGALVTPLAFAAPRDKLDGVNGVPFGATFEAAQKQLGSGAQADTDPSDPKIKILLLSSADLFGEKAGLNYSFGDKGKLSEVYAIATVPTG